MALFKRYDIFRVLESIETIMNRYFHFVKKGKTHEDALNNILDIYFPLNEPRNEIIRKNIAEYVSITLIFYPESEQMKYFIKFIIYILNKGIKSGSKDDHEINRKLFRTYNNLKKRYRIHIDEPRDDIDCLGYFESFVP